MKKLTAMLVLALVSAGLFACGGGDDSAATPVTDFPTSDSVSGDATVVYVADPDGRLAYNVTESSSSPGKVKVEFVNSQDVEHDLAIEDPSGKTIGKTARISEDIASTTVDLKPATEYIVYCTVPGHRKAGMKGHIFAREPE